jgi:hypothetical protein
MHNYCTPHLTKENFENFLIHLKCIAYDKLLKTRQSLLTALYFAGRFRAATLAKNRTVTTVVGNHIGPQIEMGVFTS